MVRRTLLTIFWTIVAFGAGAYAESTYRIQYYRLKLTPDFKAHRVTIKTQIEIDNPALDREFEFTIRAPFHVLMVKAPKHIHHFSDEQLTLTLAKPQRHFSLEITTVTENGATSASEKRPVIDDDSLFLIWSDAFYPVDWERWAPVETVIEMPVGYEAVAPGRLLHRASHSGTTRFVFSSTLPQMAFSVFADRRWTRTERDVDGFRIVTLLHPESQQFSDKIFKTSPDVLRFFSDLHGVNPTETFSFVTIPGMYGRRAFSGFVGYPPAALEKEMNSTGFDAHETSLLWWGYTTRANGPGAWQWSEGLGDYVEFMYDEARNFPRPPIFNRFREQYLSSDPSQEPLYTQLRGNTPQKYVHGKYPWIMAALRYSIGDDAFRRGLQDLFTTYRYRTFSIDEFVTVFEKASSHSLDSWRKNWLERKGVPSLKISVTQSPDTAHDSSLWNLKGTVEHDGSFTGMPLDVAFQGSQGSNTQAIQLKNPAIDFTHTGPGPVEVILDPGMKLLFRVTNSSTSSPQPFDNPK